MVAHSAGVNTHAIARRPRLRREILALAILAFMFSSLPCSQAHILLNDALQSTKIELSLRHQVLRGDMMIVSGRLSTTVNDYPIALVKVQLQYYRAEDTSFTREVIMMTSSPGGQFEDRFNTTSLLRIGPWYVNASFPSQVGYQATSTIGSFTIVVQPALSLYVSSHKIQLGQSIVFDGLLFACIPCIQDQVTVIFSRPDNTSIPISIRVTPVGGPYPGGYYNGTFTPDVPGLWHVRTIWKGNEVSLSTYSSIEELNVLKTHSGSEFQMLFYVAAAVAVVGAVILTVLLRRRNAYTNSSLPK